MPFKSGVERFIAKRAAYFLCALSVLNFILIDKCWLVFLGLLIGGVYSTIKFYTLSAALNGILNQKDKNNKKEKNIVLYIGSLMLLIVLLVFSLLYDKWLGGGVAIGTLIVPFVIMINSITEGLGITHNNFK